LRRHFTSLPKEKTARRTYPISKALAYESSTSKFCVLNFLVILIHLATTLISESSRNARKLDAYRSTCPTFSTISEHKYIRPIFVIILILNSISCRLVLILILSSLCSASSLLTISLV
jgi:hypothetical protein